MSKTNNLAAASTPETGVRSIAIAGGGISGLSVAYELARLGIPFTLLEASGRLGGTVETFRTGEFVIECGPDSWVTEKPWARELAVELGLEDQILFSNDQWRRTYLMKKGGLAPLPDGMRMMTPRKWAPLLTSPLLSWRARFAYLREPWRAAELKAAALRNSERNDESVAAFVRRHFGEEVTGSIAGPLLAGVFGGDIRELSVRAVMPAFVAMEAKHGSLITALRQRTPESKAPRPIFSTLATGLGTLIDRLVERLPAPSLHLRQPVTGIRCDDQGWRLLTAMGEQRFDSVVLATPAHVTRDLLASLSGSGQRMAALLPQQATSAVVVALAFGAAQAAAMRIPRGFGFLVPPSASNTDSPKSIGDHQLLACTFVDQKFSHRAPSGAVLLRAFFGGRSAEALLGEEDEAIALAARQQLARILGPLPAETLIEPLVRRWPLSLPQYTVGHLDRIRELESLAGAWRGLHLVGNAYHGVGVSDLIREGRAAARAIAESSA